MNTIKKLLVFSLIIANVAIGMENKEDRSKLSALINGDNDQQCTWGENEFIFPSPTESKKRKKDDDSENNKIEAYKNLAIPCMYEACPHFFPILGKTNTRLRINITTHVVKEHILCLNGADLTLHQNCSVCSKAMFNAYTKRGSQYDLLYEHYFENHQEDPNHKKLPDVLKHIRACRKEIEKLELEKKQ